MREKNAEKETPLHIAAKRDQASFFKAVLDLNRGTDNQNFAEKVLKEKDGDGNTPLHLATNAETNDKKTANLLLDFLRRHTPNPMEFINKRNISGWTPFGGAVAAGD